MTKKIRLGEGSDYILVADGKQIYKFKDSGEAEARLRMLKSKFPQRNFELKHEVCSLQDVAEGLPQTLRKVVPGHAKREIDKKMDAGKFGKTDADKDANFQRYKKIQDKLKEQGVAEGKYCIKHRTTGKVLSTHDDKSSAQDELAGIASNKDYKVAKATAPKKEFSMKENKKQDMAEGSVDQLPTQGADYSKHSTDELKSMLRPGVMHRDEARFKTLIRRELRKREQQGVAEGADPTSDSSQEARGDHRGEVKKNKDGSYVATNQAGSRKIFKSQKAAEAHANSGQQDVAEDSEVASWIDAKGSTVPAKNRKDKAEKGAPVSGPNVSDRFRTSPHGDVVTAMNRKLHIPKVKESVALPDAKLMRNIAEGLVRMDDLVLNRPVYGNPSVTDRRVVQRMVREFAEAGIDYRDAVVELVEYFRQETIKEDGLPSIPPLPTAAPAAAAPAVAPAATTTTTAAVTPDEAAKQEAAALAKIQANAGLKGQLDQLVTKSGTPAAAPAAPGQPAAAAPDYTAALAKIKANAGLAPQLTALLAKAQ